MRYSRLVREFGPVQIVVEMKRSEFLAQPLTLPT
jgi:hypothetical protein